MDLPPFSKAIKARRSELNYSLKEASRRTGIQPSRLHDLEQGRSSTTGKPTGPSRENIKKIAKGYLLDEAYLLDLSGQPKLDASTSSERRLLSHFRGLIPGHQEAILALVDHLYRLDQSP